VTSLNADFPDFATALTIHRGTALMGTATMLLVPANERQWQQGGLQPSPLDGARVLWMAMHGGTVDVRRGDELRQGSANRYAVQGTAAWGDLGTVIGLHEIK
jgi:hypothetical protein